MVELRTEKALSEVLSFKLGSEEYAIDILKVQEIRGYDAVTRIPNVPEYIKGVMNLRGVIVPIVDMRIRFNLDLPTYDVLTVVIILTISDCIVGLIVDSVSDVVNLIPEQIKPAPEMVTALDTHYLVGLGILKERTLILIDIECLLNPNEMGLFEKLAA